MLIDTNLYPIDNMSAGDLKVCRYWILDERTENLSGLRLCTILI